MTNDEKRRKAGGGVKEGNENKEKKVKISKARLWRKNFGHKFNETKNCYRLRK